jgi:hypothetical protein
MGNYGHKSGLCISHRNLVIKEKEEVVEKKVVKKKAPVKKKQAAKPKNKAITKTEDK